MRPSVLRETLCETDRLARKDSESRSEAPLRPERETVVGEAGRRRPRVIEAIWRSGAVFNLLFVIFSIRCFPFAYE